MSGNFVKFERQHKCYKILIQQNGVSFSFSDANEPHNLSDEWYSGKILVLDVRILAIKCDSSTSGTTFYKKCTNCCIQNSAALNAKR